ncbi:MAG TPA: sugar ABC transporter permease, partial [Thermoanaerobaculia bacterium]|nr:sugar ABC transporter permease [Thermoanaerobaculia bacterium]
MRVEVRSGRPAEVRAALFFLAPGLSVIVVFFFLPIAASLLLSATDFDLYALADPSNARVTGVSNYQALLSDPVFLTALRNTLVFVLLASPLTVAIALSAALLVNARTARFKGFFRTTFFAPVVTTLVAVAVVFKYVYHPRFGLLNRGLTLLGLPAVDWLGDTRFALVAIVILGVWKNFGFSTILFVAGLQGIPESLYEAARLDGAGRWQQFRRITLPLLAPTMLLVGLTRTIDYFQLFAEPYVMTRGGPANATLSVALLMYEEGFRWWNMGVGSAVGFVLFA